MKTTLYNFSNEVIQTQKENQWSLLESLRVHSEAHVYWHQKFMAEPTQENELKSLKAFEQLHYSQTNISLHMQRELEERLRLANEIIKGLCQELGKDVLDVIDEYVKYDV